MIAKIEAVHKIEAIFFDFGGVIAEEGFRNGLKGIAINEGLEPERFFESGNKAIYESGYVIGKASERRYWKLVQETTGISMPALDMRQKILQSFILKPEMIRIVNLLRAKGFFVSLLSDQTNWLDELDARHHFCRFFDTVFNSYHMGKAKRDPSLFSDVASTLGISNKNCLLIDDNHGNVMRASEAGYQTILFQSVKPCMETFFEMALISHAELKDFLK